MTATAHSTAPVDRWTDITPLRSGLRAAVSAAVARRIFERTTRRLGISVASGACADADVVLHRPDEFFARLGSDGLIGFGESYLTGAWDADDLAGTLGVLCTHIDELLPRWMQRLRAAYVARPPSAQRNTRRNARDNVAHHYDLSNDLFALFLDPTLTYSSAMFDTDEVDHGDHVVLAPPPDGADLTEAQRRKIERILDAARVDAGTTLLEIGTGWGELAIRAAARGATVRSVTLSREQQQLAEQRIAAAGLADRVTVDLLDYRDVDGRYDAVVSVEMIEAVGHEYWPTYFATLDRLLAPGGTAAIQAITMRHQRMLATRNTWTWINKYVFPGGFLPSVEAIEQVTGAHTTLQVVDRVSFGSHYAETLRQWDERFREERDRVLDLGFDETFLRLWHFYLEYSRAGFASGYIDVNQLTFRRNA